MTTAASSSARSRPNSLRGVPAPNFATSTSALSALIDNLVTTKTAAEAACIRQGEAEQKFPFKGRATPKVFGGVTDAVTITRAGKTTEIAGSEWHYHSREEIEKNETGERKTELLAAFSRQAKACKSAYPKALRTAERAAEKALDIWTAAEHALVRYRPANAAEAVELLALAARSSGPNATMPYLEIDETDFRSIAGNCAKVLQKEFSH